MRNLLLIAAVTGLGLSACEMRSEEAEEDFAPPPPPAEEIIIEQPEETPPATGETTAPPPPASDTGDLGEARPSEESVQPDSETVFY